ncbi:MAG: hypothetical protein OEZ36_08385 [Spirochaetota bacterium]|nr:hypothetical protein [Spirochaetota bacterium]
MAVSFRNVGSYGVLKEESAMLGNLMFGGDLSLNFQVFKDFNIVVPAKFIYIMYEEPLYGLSAELGAQYYF